jgi:hypothetical protein
MKYLKAILIATAIFITVCFQSPPVSAQTTIYAKFIIRDAKVNQVDITKQWVTDSAYLVIYTIKDDKNIYFASVNPKQKSQSYGAISKLKVSTESATEDNYENETFNFNWSYSNSYNDKVGTSAIKLLKIMKEGGIEFSCTIVTEGLDIMVYRGYMEGSLKNLE